MADVMDGQIEKYKIGIDVVVFLLVKFEVLFGQFCGDFKRVDTEPVHGEPCLDGQVLMGRVHHVSLEVGHKTLDEIHDT